MGKKKDKARRKHAERRAAMSVDLPPHVAGIAAAALKQVDTPAFKQMIAGALGAAAQAFDQRRGQRRAEAAPPGPVPPAAPASEPRVETPELKLSPEAARAMEQAATQATRAVESAAALAAQAIDGVAAALGRWASKQAAAGRPGDQQASPAGD